MKKQDIIHLDKLDFEKFLKEELTVAENRIYTKNVDEMFAQIIESIFEAYGYNIVQFDYNVEPYDDDVEEGCNAFNVELFKQNVAFYANVSPFDKNSIVLPPCFISLYKQFPTKWFHTDFSQELAQIVAQDWESFKKHNLNKQKEKQNEVKKIQGYEKDVKQARMEILDILPAHLVKYIKFVSAQELEDNIKRYEAEKGKMRDKKIKKLKSKGFDIRDNYLKNKEKNPNQNFEDWIDSLE